MLILQQSPAWVHDPLSLSGLTKHLCVVLIYANPIQTGQLPPFPPRGLSQWTYMESFVHQKCPYGEGTQRPFLCRANPHSFVIRQGADETSSCSSAALGRRRLFLWARSLAGGIRPNSGSGKGRKRISLVLGSAVGWEVAFALRHWSGKCN